MAFWKQCGVEFERRTKQISLSVLFSLLVPGIYFVASKWAHVTSGEAQVVEIGLLAYVAFAIWNNIDDNGESASFAKSALAAALAAVAYRVGEVSGIIAAVIVFVTSGSLWRNPYGGLHDLIPDVDDVVAQVPVCASGVGLYYVMQGDVSTGSMCTYIGLTLMFCIVFMTVFIRARKTLRRQQKPTG